MRRDFITGSAFLIFCAVLWLYLIPTTIQGEEQAIYPRLVTLFLSIPAVLLLFRAHPPSPPPALSLPLTPRVCTQLFLVVLGYALYIFSLEIAGFFIATFLFCVLVLLFLGEKKLRTILLTPVLLLCALYVLIVYCLNYPLPQASSALEGTTVTQVYRAATHSPQA